MERCTAYTLSPHEKTGLVSVSENSTDSNKLYGHAFVDRITVSLLCSYVRLLTSFPHLPLFHKCYCLHLAVPIILAGCRCRSSTVKEPSSQVEVLVGPSSIAWKITSTKADRDQPRLLQIALRIPMQCAYCRSRAASRGFALARIRKDDAIPQLGRGKSGLS